MRTFLRAHGGLLFVLVPWLILLARFFEWFPDGWDQTEYALCVRAGYLPHSPYVLHLLAGRLLGLVFSPPVALSALSAASGLVALVAFHGVNRRGVLPAADSRFRIADFGFRIAQTGQGGPHVDVGVTPEGLKSAIRNPQSAIGNSGRERAGIAVALLGLTYAFVRQASTQEVYAFQTALVLLALALLRGKGRLSQAGSGAVFGCAVAAHEATLLLLPAFGLAVAWRWRAGRLRAMLRWGLAATAVCVLSVALLAAWLRPAGGESHSPGLADYLRGASPEVRLSRLAEPGFLGRSMRGLYRRLCSVEVETSRSPRATTPVGTGELSLLVALLGAAVGLWRNRREAGFWLAYAVPFLAYEVALGRNLDYGLYVPFVLPPLCSLTAGAVSALSAARLPQPLLRGLQGAALLALLFPSGGLVWRDWDSVRRDALAHFSPTTLAASWMSRHLPANAVVIQAQSERNANILPYYALRQHIQRERGLLIVFESRGPFTPLNFTSFSLVTTGRLKAWLREGRPIYAFEAEPLAPCSREEIDPRAFDWPAAASMRPSDEAAHLGLPGWLRRQSPDQHVVLYRCRAR